VSGNAVVPHRLGIDTRKICNDLLDVTHPHGGPKARFFRGCGFAPTESLAFADALFAEAKGAALVARQPSEYGADMLTCVGPLGTPSGRRPWIRSVWLVIAEAEGETGRFGAAFPDRNRSAPSP